MKDYTYNCIDKSILLPYFKKYYVSIFYKLVPRGLTANFITLLSSGFVFYMLYTATLARPANSTCFAIILAICLHNYVVGDHLDGMQAKITNTSSPLGEYLDHYLDVYNGAIVMFALTVFFAPLPKVVFYAFLVLNALSFAITMVEQLERQKLVFGILGTLEGILLLILFFLTWLFEPVRQFWRQELYAGYARYWLIIVFFALGYAGTMVDVVRRIKYVPGQFIVFALVVLLLAFSLFQLGFSNIVSWLIVTLFSGEYISKVMESYLVGRKHKYPDLAVSLVVTGIVLAVVSEMIPFALLAKLLVILACYLGIKTMVLFLAVIYRFRDHWFWINPSS